MFHPHRTFDIGFNARLPIVLDTTGTVDATPPPAAQIRCTQDKAEFHTRLPPVVRLGIRYKFLGNDDFEHGDIEVDGTWEGWNWAEGTGDRVVIPQLGPFSDIHPTHHAQLSGHLQRPRRRRLQHPLAGGRASRSASASTSTRRRRSTRTRASTSTPWPSTRGTAGLGYSVRGMTLNVAYAYI